MTKAEYIFLNLKTINFEFSETIHGKKANYNTGN